MSDGMGPLLGRFGPGVAWIVVILAGIPAAAVGAAMLRGVRSRALRPLFITAGALLAGVLLLLMTALNLLVKLGYIPYAVLGLFTGAKFARTFLESLTQWATMHQLLCLLGGFLWLAATVCYGRRSGGACV
jgi:undecaprenyl pyrophosphate phosphatase UppP